MTELNFNVTVTTDDTSGQVLSAYFQIRKGKVHETREFADGAAFADYNNRGELIGIELLAPCRVTIVNQLAANESPTVRQRTKKYMREAGPRWMVVS
ncbi:MAG: DUF2283 domain-containing protein [Planctomycetes bacterium]|nr:DUF2283 domain-containing protein [Planctomycetota bacterium]